MDFEDFSDTNLKRFTYAYSDDLEVHPQKVECLSVDFSKTGGQLPEVLLSMLNLEHLELKNYPHKYELPEGFTKLDKITSISFWPKIPVTQLPKPILGLPLKTLEVSGLNVKLAAEFPDLETLHMHTSNPMEALQKLAGQLQKLKTLEITPTNQNAIGFPQEIKAFGQLERLVLNGLFADFPVEFCDMPHLKHLTWNADATFEIADELVSALRTFESLELKNAAITGFPERFTQLKPLKRFLLPHCFNDYIRGRWAGGKVNHKTPLPVPTCFSDLESLEELNLSHCALSDISALGHLKKLRKLNLGWIESSMFGGKPYEVNFSALKDLTNLEELNLEMTQFNKPALLNSPHMKKLNLNKCYAIRDFSFLSQMPKLQVLSMQGMDFYEEEGVADELKNTESLGQLTELRTLNIAGRNFKDMAVVSRMPQLEHLDITSCENIKDIAPILQHPSLKELRADKAIMAQWKNNK
ncbi:MAG: hypothetical protein AAGJ12_06950 [Bacteroidota bacterium]